MLPCLFKAWSGMDCPGCGMQRSIYSLITGHAAEAFRFHPAGPVFLLLVLITCIHLFVRPIPRGHIIIVAGFSATAVLTTIFYIYKLTHGLV